jgi:CheY-like chemotaxis protein
MPQGGKLILETGRVDLDAADARSHVEVSPGPYVMLAVSDTGCGMTRELQNRIFEPFFTTKEKDKGTGLGLSTVYGIVKQSGGNIWLYSEPGTGTTFKIYLPRVEEAAEVVEGDEPAVKGAGHETILLVEDDEAVRRLTRGILESTGYTVLEAMDGEEALNLAGKHRESIDVLLTDMVMPRMSGKKLARLISARHPHVRVLYLSGYTNEAITQLGALDPGEAFLQKPFTPQLLVNKLREVLDAPAHALSD